MTATLSIRPRRQITLPLEFLEAVGVSVGDRLEANLNGNQIVLKTKKDVFLDALAEIQKSVKASGVKEKVLQNAAKQQREQWAKQKYGLS